jgi:putative membrane protein
LRNLFFYIFLFIKGLCIGATGVLQAISGGSMALLLGVHQEMIQSIHAINRNTLKLPGTNRFAASWKKINGSFLVSLLTGIAVGLVTLRSLFGFYVDRYPIFISSFFFSLVIIAALLLLRKITRWNAGVVLSVLVGCSLTYLLTRAAPFTTPDNRFYDFLSGLAAGATFIIPGVSGAFILMFIGKYQFILTSFGSLEFDVIILFIAGGILGLIITARFVATLLSEYYNATVGLFAGLMIGSLNKIWPWRQVFEYATTIEGKRIPAFDKSILPWRYLEITGKDPQLFYAILMMASGVLMVVLIEKIAARLKTKS